MRTVEIGRVVDPVVKWDPRREGAGTLTYIDLSSIDQRTKAVAEPTTIEASEAPARARQLIASGDVLVSTVRPNLNAVAYVQPDLDGATASTGFCVLRPRPDELDGRYLYHWTRAVPFVGYLVQLATGASYPAVSDKIVKAAPIPLPLLDDQRRIAAVLDAAEALRAKRRHALTKLESLTQAIFIDLFADPIANPHGWPMVRLGEVLRSATYGTSKKSGADGLFPVLRMGNLTFDGHLDLSDMKFVDLDEREIERHTVRKGDVLFNRTNSADLVGKTAVYRLEESMAYAGYLIRLRPKPSLDSEYLGTFMNLPTTKLLLRSMCRSIVGMANINAREVQTVRLPLPPQERQASFSVAHAGVVQQRFRLERQLRSLDTLHASLRQRAFRGEL